MATRSKLTAHLSRIKGFYPTPFSNRRIGKGKPSLKKISLFPQRDPPRSPLFQIGHEPIYVKTLSDRMTEMRVTDLDTDINIGYKNPQPLQMSRAQRRALLSTRSRLEKAARLRQIKIPLEEVKATWLEENAFSDIRNVLEHYGIFRDLFNGAYFYPLLKFSVSYDYDHDFVTPVHYGNIISASDAQTAPDIHFAASDDAHYSVLLTNPDGHLRDNRGEYLHWFVGNMCGGDATTGETLCTYLPPFPPRGTGFHRLVFLLFRHVQKLAFDMPHIDSISLDNRTFSTLEFYRKHQDHITPVDLVFFQSEWDASVTRTFHHVLGMKEPAFEFMHPPPYHPRQVLSPHKQPFNIYLDRYRDKKDLGEEILKERLKRVAPFKGPVLRPKFPNAVKIPMTTAQWLRAKIQDQRSGVGIWRDLHDD